MHQVDIGSSTLVFQFLFLLLYPIADCPISRLQGTSVPRQCRLILLAVVEYCTYRFV